MFHVKQWFLFGCMLLGAMSIFAQTRNGGIHPVLEGKFPLVKDVMDSTKASGDIRQFSSVEQDVLYLMNLARMKPLLFRDSVLMPYLKANPALIPDYGASLSKELLNNKPVSPMYAHAVSRTVALGHARDLARTGNISHQGSDGNGPKERLNAAGIFCGSECIHYSNYPHTVQMVLSLLIDKDVPGVGHRRAMMAAGNTKGGVGVVKSNEGINILVINMSCD